MKKIICPGCGSSNRIIYLINKNSYQCTNCGQIWERESPVVRKKLYRCPHCGNEWQEADILIGENKQAEE